jgi:isorenieratene synthase
LPFDVARRPFSTGIWEPMRRYVEARGAVVRTGTAVLGIRRAADRWAIDTGGASDPIEAGAVALALDVAGLKRLLPATPFDRGDWADRVRALEVTLPFAVWRLWLDRPTADGRAPFAGTAGFPLLDNISLYHLFEDESRAWASEHGGSVVELHAYAVPDGTTEQELRAAMLAGLHQLYPETRTARPLDEVYLLRNDCPAFAPGSHAGRPGTATPHAGIYLAGDFVRMQQPSALMERAAASGIAAANAILAEYGLRPEPVASIRPNGILPAAAA